MAVKFKAPGPLPPGNGAHAEKQIFFRFIKQNLKIKAGIGNFENAVLTQIYVTLIVYLLLGVLKFLCNINITLRNCIRRPQLNHFMTCTLQKLFEPPEMIADNRCYPKQLTLALTYPDRNGLDQVKKKKLAERGSPGQLKGKIIFNVPSFAIYL